MHTKPKHHLLKTAWPEFGRCAPPPRAPAGAYAARLNSARGAMERLGLTHLVVYGDREHFANLAWLTGFDPRFEEALLIISNRAKPLLVVGNECEGYLSISPLYRAGRIRSERFQTFSLLNQPRDSSRLLADIFAGEGIGRKSKVGCAGWKYFADSEIPDALHAVDLPAYMADALRALAGRSGVTNATAIFMHPDHGLRTFCSPAEIAYFEYTNILASEGVKRIIFGMRLGMTDFDLAGLAGYNGEPFGCHMTMVTGKARDRGLAGPSGEIIRRGKPLAANVSYWGSNICRAGWIARGGRDLPEAARGYVKNFAGVYFEVMAGWFGLLKIGAQGGALERFIRLNLPFKKFGVFLNPGHLIHLDEWVSSPVYPGSGIKLHSGMAIQVDVIPSSKTYFSTRMEDGLVLADASLQRRLGKEYPECLARCLKRREFMRNKLGMPVHDDVLPLSNMPAIVPPFFLEPENILALED